MKKDNHTNINGKKSGVSVKIYFKKQKNVIKEGHCVMVKVNEEDITIINIYALNNRVLKYTQCKN